MKKIIALVLACCLLLSACGQAADTSISADANIVSSADNSTVSQEDVSDLGEPDFSGDTSVVSAGFHPIIPEYNSLNDPSLLDCVEDSVYAELVSNLNDSYFVQNVSAVYVSNEYLEEVSYNSKSNIFFGYTLAELDKQFQGTRYVFTLSNEGETTVEPFEEYDDVYEKAIKNVAIGSGVILICVTVSVVSGGVGAQAVSIIFATSAKTGTIMALSSGGVGALASGIVTGVQTKDFDEAVKAAALVGSESFKWGAISGALIGGASEAVALKGATLNGLTMDEAATIQQTSKWLLDAIKNIHSIEEYNIYKEANLIPTKLADGKLVFLKQIDWTLTDAYGRTNVQRVGANLAPIDAAGTPLELHHIGQKADSPLAILSWAEHHSPGNYSILHYAEQGKDISDAAWNKQKQEIWKAILKMAQGA